MQGDELSAAGGLQQRGERERIAPTLAAVDADDDAREHRVLLSCRHTDATPEEPCRHR
jgi:hypothetical protein